MRGTGKLMMFERNWQVNDVWEGMASLGWCVRDGLASS